MKKVLSLILKFFWRPLVFVGVFSLSFWAAVASYAKPPEIISKILVEGQKRIEKEALLNKLESKVGEALDPEKIRKDVLNLFQSGFYYDVIVEKKNIDKGHINLIYKVVEKPVIASISYKGNDEVNTEELEGITELKSYEILDNSKLQSVVEKIEKHYEEKGYFLARVQALTSPSKDKKQKDAVDVTFNIKENDKVLVKEIKFIGNQKLDASHLKNYMRTKEGAFFSFISDSGSYRQDTFDQDMQILNLVYFNEGFLQVKIDRPLVFVSPDKKGIYITIRIEEGEQYRIGNIDFAGDLLFSDGDLRKNLRLKPGETFSYEKLQSDIRELTAKYGDLGYAYANPIPRNHIHEKERIVDITFDIDKGNKVYIGKINITGNTKTRDKVVRRELRIHEGELYNETRKRESLARVKRLGFFEEVNLHTKTPTGHDDLMDMDIVVKERNTGTLQIGAGYSSLDGFVLNGQVNQINFLGRGQRLGLSIDWAKTRKNVTASFTEPYFLDTQWEVGVDGYYRDRVLPDYNEHKQGGGIDIAHPLAPYLNAGVGYKLDTTRLTYNSTDTDIFPLETANGLTSAVTLSLDYDKRDDRFAPTNGIYSRVYVEYAGLGGDLDYTKGGAIFRYYKKVFWDIVWRNNLTYGFVSSNDSQREVPFNELYLLGGPNTLRGYDPFTVGKRKFSHIAYTSAVAAGSTDPNSDAMRPFGGRQQLYYNVEMQFPLIQEAGILGVVFYDVGYADDSLRLSDFKGDVGFGFRWFSPIGPLRFEWGFATNPEKKYGEDSSGNFQFMIGSPF